MITVFLKSLKTGNIEHIVSINTDNANVAVSKALAKYGDNFSVTWKIIDKTVHKNPGRPVTKIKPIGNIDFGCL